MRNSVFIVLVTMALGGCESTSPATAKESGPSATSKAETAKKSTAAAATKGKTTPKKAETKAADAKKGEVVFDPRTPPAGFTNCHRNHCHRVGGGVASYKQVMEEIGATKMVGVPKQKPMPKAPTDVAGPGPDVEVTASGLASKLIRKGDGGRKPVKTDVVTVHYTGWTTDGKAFDSSVSRGRPATFPLNRVIPGWSEGVQLMTIGEERRFWIPEHLAYKGRQGAPQGMLVFDVELIGIR
jgi:FKBP-type peptidyl-prolyl cis-trans isomerase